MKNKRVSRKGSGKGYPYPAELKELNRRFLFSNISVHPSTPTKPWVVRFREQEDKPVATRKFRTQESAEDGAFLIDEVVNHITQPRPELKRELESTAREVQAEEEREPADSFYEGTPVKPKADQCKYCKKDMGHFYPETDHEAAYWMDGRFCGEDCIKASRHIAEKYNEMLNGTVSIEEAERLISEVPDGYGNPMLIWSQMIEPIRSDRRRTIPLQAEVKSDD
jgi:hypothetical protein